MAVKILNRRANREYDIIEKYESLLPSGFSFSTTITMAMLMDQYRVEYVPNNYKKRRTHNE